MNFSPGLCSGVLLSVRLFPEVEWITVGKNTKYQFFMLTSLQKLQQDHLVYRRALLRSTKATNNFLQTCSGPGKMVVMVAFSACCSMFSMEHE